MFPVLFIQLEFRFEGINFVIVAQLVARLRLDKLLVRRRPSLSPVGSYKFHNPLRAFEELVLLTLLTFCITGILNCSL